MGLFVTLIIIIISTILCLVAARFSEQFKYKNVEILVNEGFYAFDYKRASVPVSKAFYYRHAGLTVLNVFDCFCSGDAFEIFDNGILLGMSTSATPDPGECQKFSSEAVVCWFSAGLVWTIFLSQMNPGFHNITIVPTITPYGKGTAFLRVDSFCVIIPPTLKHRGVKYEPTQETTDKVSQQSVLPGPSDVTLCCEMDNSCKLNTLN